ncbi:MAG: DUF1304 domain-containing protein [Bacteroidia bacterium]|nr:DUF1304 domain-containing protein [Bacteroidia bacterium]
MHLLTQLLIGIIAFFHIYILWFEMFAWEKHGPKVFRKVPKDLFPKTKAMAANQGLYNGFLAAGLIWSLLIQDASWSNNVALFFLSCGAIAGLYGAYSVDRKILYIQTIPSAIAIVFLLLG